jgi:translation elongation factor EF-G
MRRRSCNHTTADCTSAAQVLKHLYRQLVRKGMRMICVITKVDLVDEEVAEDVAAVQTSFLTHVMRQCVSQNTGLPMNQVRRARAWQHVRFRAEWHA